MRLHDLAHARAGDKGDISDISVFAHDPQHYAYLREWLTPDVVARHLAHVVTGRIDRFEVPGLHALKLVLHGALDGGVTRSLALDIHGKSLSSILLQLEVPTADLPHLTTTPGAP